MTTTYATADDAKLDIITAIEATGEVAEATTAYDIDAIFDATYEYDNDAQAFVQAATTREFWTAVEEHAKGGDLYDSRTAERIGEATQEQCAASAAAGPEGHILIDATTGTVLPPGADKAVWPQQRSVYVA